MQSTANISKRIGIGAYIGEYCLLGIGSTWWRNYQVSLSVRDEATMKRELAPLQSISDNYPKYLLTLDNDPVVMHNGIKQQYALDWLTDIY